MSALKEFNYETTLNRSSSGSKSITFSTESIPSDAIIDSVSLTYLVHATRAKVIENVVVTLPVYYYFGNVRPGSDETFTTTDPSWYNPL